MVRAIIAHPDDVSDFHQAYSRYQGKVSIQQISLKAGLFSYCSMKQSKVDLLSIP